MSKKRLAIFLFYDKDGVIDEYIPYLIDQISAYHVVFVSRCELTNPECIEGKVNDIVVYEDCVTESAALKRVILEHFSRDDFRMYDELIVLNNSFFGFLHGFEAVLEKAEQKNSNADFWGISSVSAGYNRMRYCRYITRPWSVQMYFYIVRERLFHSDDFYDYWVDMPVITGREIEKQRYDFDFTRYFTDLGYTPMVLFNTSDDFINNVSFQECELLSKGFPIVKRLTFTVPYKDSLSFSTKSPAASVMHYISENTEYDPNFIHKLLLRISNPYEILSTFNYNFVLSTEHQSVSAAGEALRKTVFVFHMHYEELFDKNLRYLNNLPEYIDIIITTTSPERLNKLTRAIDSFDEEFSKRVTVLCSTGNGRDMAGLLVEARPYLSAYEYIGFTHDKMSAQYDKATGDAFAKIIVDNMIASKEYVNNVLNVFDNNEHIGLLVPPTPEHAKYFATIGRRWCGCYHAYLELCEKLQIPSFPSSAVPVSLGTAFWCRYEALQSLFIYPWEHEDFPDEPLPLDGSISHGIERSFPFIAQTDGYYTGVIYTTDQAEEYLNNRAYDCTQYLTVTNRYVSMEHQTLASYINKTELRFNKINKDISSVNHAKQVIRNVKLISRSSLFNKRWYVETYPEVKDYGGIPAEHYYAVGWKREYDPSPKFSTHEYLTLNPKVRSKGINPLVHYIGSGKSSPRGLTSSSKYKPHKAIRAIKRTIANAVYKTTIKQNGDTRILVILHLFYMSAWKEIKEYLKNLSVYNYTLLVTYTNVIYDEKVIEDIVNFKDDVILKECDNVGYDVWPFISALDDVNLDDYDILFKLQSKGTKRKRIYIYGNFFKKRDWFLNLYEGCIGAFTVHKSIQKLMDKSQNIGIVAAENLIVEDPPHKKNMVINYMMQENMEIPDEYRYVAGTCFACKPQIMKPIKEHGYTTDDFTKTGRDFSKAHKLERIICLTANSCGYGFSGNNVMKLRRFIRSFDPHRTIMKKYSYKKVIEDPRFELDDEFVYFSLEMRLVKKYEYLEIPVKDIRRRWLGNDIPISETLPYQYLATGNPRVYDEYCRLNEKFYKLSIMSRERFDTLIESMDKNGFDPKHVVVVNRNNVIIDGQHRCCYMLYKYGENAKIPVLKIYEYRTPKQIIGSAIMPAIHRAGDFFEKHLSPKAFKGLAKLYMKLKGLVR